jgi:hypothetical protein
MRKEGRMREMMINGRAIAVLVASAAFAIAAPNRAISADPEPAAEAAPSPAVVAAVQPSPEQPAPPQTSSAGEETAPAPPALTQLGRPLPVPGWALPPPVWTPVAPVWTPPAPTLRRPAPTWTRPAPIRRTVRRAPARPAPAALRVARTELPVLPVRSINLFGVGFGY